MKVFLSHKMHGVSVEEVIALREKMMLYLTERFPGKLIDIIDNYLLRRGNRYSNAFGNSPGWRRRAGSVRGNPHRRAVKNYYGEVIKNERKEVCYDRYRERW